MVHVAPNAISQRGGLPHRLDWASIFSPDKSIALSATSILDGTLLNKLNCSVLRLNLPYFDAQDIPRVELCQDFMCFELRVTSYALAKKGIGHGVTLRP